MRFTQHGYYVNFARADPALFEVSNTRIKLRRMGPFCIGIMSGVSTDSYIDSSVTVGPARAPYQQHRVTVVPFHQEFRRDTSAWGAILGFNLIPATINANGFAFVTRGEGKSVTFENREHTRSSGSLPLTPPVLGSGYGHPVSPSTPKRPSASSMFSSVTSPQMARPAMSAPVTACLNFESRS